MLAIHASTLIIPLFFRAALGKLKSSVSNFVRIDKETCSRAQDCFANALYGKFLGRPPPLEIVNNVWVTRCREWGEVTVADLPNGYFLIRCATQLAMQNILFAGPWTFNGLVLQLSSRHAFFKPVNARLLTAVIWLQPHHLSVELWEADVL